LTKGGIGTVRIRFPLPTRSTNTQRPSCCWMWGLTLREIQPHAKPETVGQAWQIVGSPCVQYARVNFCRDAAGSPYTDKRELGGYARLGGTN
jgi:hypothetical protein